MQFYLYVTLLIFLQGFGFMREAPLERLPEYFNPWEDLLKKMPQLLKRDEDESQRTSHAGEDFYAEVSKMPLLDPAALSDAVLKFFETIHYD